MAQIWLIRCTFDKILIKDIKSNLGQNKRAGDSPARNYFFSFQGAQAPHSLLVNKSTILLTFYNHLA